MNTKTGIYIHVPFCIKKCGYCDFFSVTGKEHRENYVSAIETEIEETARNNDKIHVDTIYFGGGTPSILDCFEIERIISKLYSKFDCSEVAESTIECNPGAISKEKAHLLKNLAFNRASLGVQSFVDQELMALGRIHSSAEALMAIEILKETGFVKLNVDLLFGIPGGTANSFRQNLETAIALDIPHLSVYGLTFEKRTPFHDLFENGTIKPLSEESYESAFLMAHNLLENAGYLHYEISNYAKPEKKSIHNVNCWKGKNYLGFGPSAHSRLGKLRYANVRNIEAYIKNPIVREFEQTVTKGEERLELFMLGLRTADGIKVDGFQHSRTIDRLAKEGLAKIKGDMLCLTERGMLLLDEIITILEEDKCLTLK